MTTRAERRAEAIRVQAARRRVELRRRVALSFPLTIRQIGKRHNHTGCGCRMCKPWKHEGNRA